jgi:bifunctional UDP-N-acetylglucosamine pyrophosphorylase/glucosamine-1-phosphate N-acetyltransferase
LIHAHALFNYSNKENAVSVATVILAAGQGTRMKSSIAKVLHPVGGKPMVLRAVATAEQLATDRPVLIVGHSAEAVRAAVGERVICVEQAELLGTGHAVMQAESLLRGQAELVAVFYADMPLLRAETISRLIATQRGHRGPITMLTVTLPDSRGFGRVLRGEDGAVTAIVEERECTSAQLTIRELNAGVYVFRADWLWANLPRLKPQSKGEYYLTDLIQIAADAGEPVHGLEAEDPDEVTGINNRVHLAEAEAALRRRNNRHWMLEGVTILDPETTYIDEDVIIGQDACILPNTHLEGQTIIGPHSVIGPNTVIRDSRIGAHCKVDSSVVEYAITEDYVEMGPYCHLRRGAYLAEGVHMGNFGEVKNARLGRKTRMGHFSYIGDAEIGEDVNIGAGTITANFDGIRKHKTIVGDHAFIGSDTMLIAPVTVEANARTAAGAVVTRDVPSGQIAVGVPARLRDIRSPEPTE